MLTAKKVERIKAPGRYHDGHGLYLQVRNGNNKSWLLRYERAGVGERWYGIGPTHTVTLKQARERARAAKLLLLDGVDPIEFRKEQRAKRAAEKAATIMFKEAARRYFDQHESKWRSAKHRWQWLASLESYAYPVLADMAVADIDTAAVLRAIEPHWLTKTETMNRVRGRIESVLNWCKVRGYRQGDNPAAWKGHLGELLPARAQVAKVEHHPAMPYAELPGFITKLRKREGTAARALEFLILSCARSGEVLGARWPEIHWDERMWVVPEHRMKSGREHRVALSQRAIELLRELPREGGNDRIFIGSRPGTGIGAQSMMQVIRRMGRADISAHGFRANFKSWSTECTRFPNEMIEMALSHAVGDKTERAYQRADMLKKRHALAEAWAPFCARPAPAGATVVPLHEAARA